MMVESLFALARSIRTRSRSFLQIAVLALLADAIAQLGPAFLVLQRWVQIGIIGKPLTRRRVIRPVPARGDYHYLKTCFGRTVKME